jgi:hypothetical protein
MDAGSGSNNDISCEHETERERAGDIQSTNRQLSSEAMYHDAGIESKSP